MKTYRGCLKNLFFLVGLGLTVPSHSVAATPDRKAEPSSSTASASSNGSSKDSSKGVSQSLFETSGDKNQPLLIKSKSLSLDSKGRTFTYDGNVEVVQGDLTITAATMVGLYDEKNRIRTITCKDNVVITKGPDMKANANRAVYNVLAGTIELTEGPELINKGNALSADKVTIFVEEDRSEAEGDVRVRVVKTEGDGKAPAVGGLFTPDIKGDGAAKKESSG